MAEKKERKEKFIELPNDLLDKFNGFSLDFGKYLCRPILFLRHLSDDSYKDMYKKDKR